MAGVRAAARRAALAGSVTMHCAIRRKRSSSSGGGAGRGDGTATLRLAAMYAAIAESPSTTRATATPMS